jgi:hypothetical protein
LLCNVSILIYTFKKYFMINLHFLKIDIRSIYVE